ncbi:hypothetical protein GGR58DRAFT_518846 [Xylaria digitata]|nr:hypothetical protein GGR58DRAFT_518846 [Xylaria digitata]
MLYTPASDISCPALYLELMDPDNKSNSLLPKLHYNKPIIANNFSYRTLVNVARLRLDQKTATLKLFRFPSFCAMLALPKASKSNAIAHNDESNLASEPAAPYSQDFFLKVLYPLRLIFSQHKSAHYLYKKSFQTNPKGVGIVDPLLNNICGSKSRNPAVYKEICAFPEKGIYSSFADFPLLAHRLLILQNFVGAQNPNDLGSLFNNTRDLNRFYTF